MEFVKCDYCGRSLPENLTVFLEDEGIHVCSYCADEHLVTCERCGTLIDRDDAYLSFPGYLCECCHDDLYG